MSSNPNWSELPPELLDTIGAKLTILRDFIYFRAVCSNWRSSTPPTPKALPCQLPWLMLSQTPNRRRAFFDLATNHLVSLHLPEASLRRRRRCGSSHGWLVILDELPPVFIINPLTKVKVDLPPLTRFPNVTNFDIHSVGREYTLRSPDRTRSLKAMRDLFIRKVVLSSSPSVDRDFVAVAILNETNELAYWKNGNDWWKLIDDAWMYSEDVICFDGLFYAVNGYGQIAVIDVSGELPTVSFVQTPMLVGADVQYLVKTADELLLVTRLLDHDFDVAFHQLDVKFKTIEFQVSRLMFEGGPSWEKVRCLGDYMLFLGENSSLALLASDFPGCKGNRIYFTDDYCEVNYDGVVGNHDLGYYNLDNGRIEALPSYPRNSHSVLNWPPPIWFTPNPC